MKTLTIEWQRLVSDGETCPRCGSTEEQLESAVSQLRNMLASLDIEVVFKKGELSASAFEKAPLSSNQIWINQRPLEEWIGAQVGQSPCCGVCGPSECRTVEMAEQSYETVPADMIIKSALLAVSQQFVSASNELHCEGEKLDPEASTRS